MRFSQHNGMYLILLLFIHFPALILSSSSPSTVPCRSIDAIFQKSADNNETAACKCFPSGFDSRLDGIVIGCSGHVLPSIFKALRALNDTSIGKLRISDALVNILPSDMFKDMRMKKLQVERAGLAVLREGAFASLGSRLRELSLRHNNIKKIEKNTFDGLAKLQKLDLSGNRISSLESGTFDNVPELRELSINDNDISVIADGAFSKLTGLKKLSIVGNQINNISKNMFKGLDSLEVLQLQGNQITAIDWSAFNNLKQLKILDLGTNHVTQVIIPIHNSLVIFL
ncbi:hypothetical protein WR25_02939 [Diploscapter pachys]|uniref:LRRCT domain-containing protein n=1 Tax=Diploscapter pachys TaxID=2018661 RepID=A0A2A2L310_9BILA|nr:hypothetical protein WR25_02939 [Diploscapter pachys]